MTDVQATLAELAAGGLPSEMLDHRIDGVYRLWTRYMVGRRHVIATIELLHDGRWFARHFDHDGRPLARGRDVLGTREQAIESLLARKAEVSIF